MDEPINSRRTRIEIITHLPGVIGDSAAMRKIAETVKLVAMSDAPILIYGETGTGKELAAKAVHLFSKRKEGPFIPVNCGAIPEGLIESELFGYERGAFTGAVGQKRGFWELAHNGTLFLDEIGDLPLLAQTKILSALQEKKIFRVGGTREINVNVRIVAATNKNLFADVGAGTFRNDLYYRINVIVIDMPPLRQRREDIPMLAAHFASLFEANVGHPVVFSDSAIRHLQSSYDWPGNIRELENIILRAITLNPEAPVLYAQLLTFLHESAESDATALSAKPI